MAEASFQIDVGVQAAGVDSAAASLAALSEKLTAAGQASTAASDALKAGETAYQKAESAADGAAKAVEKLGVAVELQRSKLKAAMDAGDDKKFWKLAAGLNALNEKQEQAAAKSALAKSALADQATTLDRLRAAAVNAAASEKLVAKGIDDARLAANKQAAAAKTAADAAKRAQEAAAGSGNAKKTARAFADIGGPLGTLAQKFFSAKDTVQDFTETLGSKAPYAIAAAGAAAAAAAIVAVTAAAAAGIATVLKWGVGLADKTKELDKLQKKFGDTIAKTFGGLKIDKLLKGMDNLVDLFDESNASGRAMKTVFESLFQPLIDGIVDLIPKIRSGFIQFEILVLKALIAIKPFGSEIAFVGKALLVFSAVVIGVFVAVILLAIAQVVAIIAAFAYLNEAANSVGKSIADFFKTLDLQQIGTDIINGLINGITNAGPAVLRALTGVVSGAVTAAKKLLGIASPSKVFAEIGMQTGEGMAGGVEASTGSVQGALESMVSPPATGSGSGASASGGAGTYNFVINAEGGDPDAIEAAVRRALLSVVEGAQAQIGAAVPA